MEIKQFEKKMEEMRGKLSPSEILNTVFDLLEKNPTWEEREVLEGWLMTFSIADHDRVALYWKNHLYQGSHTRKVVASTFLTVLAKRNEVARNILREYLATTNPEDDPNVENLRTRFQEIDK